MVEHKCPTCDVSRSISAIRKAVGVLDDATEAWLNTSEEQGMDLAYAEDRLQKMAELAGYFNDIVSSVYPAANPAGIRAYLYAAKHIKAILAGEFDGLPFGVRR